MLNELIRANDCHIETFSGQYPWDCAEDINKWLESQGPDVYIINVLFHQKMESDGSTGPAWATIMYGRKPHSINATEIEGPVTGKKEPKDH